MGTIVAIHNTYNKYVFEFEFNVGAAGAVVANSDGSTSTDPEVSVVRTAAGTYRVTIPNGYAKVIRRSAEYVPAGAGSSAQAQITAVGLGAGTPTASGTATSTVTVVTAVSGAAPAAADLTSGSVSVYIALQGAPV